MGCALSSPVELIRVQRHGSSCFRVGVAEMQGWRTGHEDGHSMSFENDSACCFVLDGHGGDGAALYSAPDLNKEFKGTCKTDELCPDKRIEQGFTVADERLRAHFKENPDKDSGTTVTGALACKQSNGLYKIKLLNAGDSRGVLVRGPNEDASTAKPYTILRPSHIEVLAEQNGASAYGNCVKSMNPDCVEETSDNSSGNIVVVQTVDHKPDHPTEKSRIEKGGGHVTEEDPPRLNGNLAVSRGLGDFEYKQDLRNAADNEVSCIPDIYEISDIAPGTICILGCDGVWDVMTASFAGAFVRDRLQRKPNADLGDIAAEMIRVSLQRNSRDNVTVMIMHFVDGSDWENHPDEMKNHEKLLEAESFEDDVKKHYKAFLRRCEFPLEPNPCDTCQRWMSEMKQCPCKTVQYCNRACQKKGWKTHKLVCTAVNSGSVSPSSSSLTKQSN
eukprot:TRINITY_DN14661_c0_g1_i1.p1 TRINITY_DN14661_c0_g1~~TRINITY_DN14661_c0_g1_i1.p1  ORF type:complete len:445 (+),score=66.82 TRINITY_DN14661_c0_g1_i1:153-1487(+)